MIILKIYSLHIKRLLGSRQRSTIQQLDLSGFGLELVDMSEFVSLKLLSLSNNRITNSSLDVSGIPSLPHLEHLELDNNEINNLTRLCEFIDRLSELKHLFIQGNKCFKDNNSDLRKRLLNGLQNNRKLGFKIETLNEQPITIDERIQSLEPSLSSDELDDFRSELVVESMNIDESIQVLDLSGKGLKSVRAVQKFINLTHLNLSKNRITNLERQELGNLPRLQSLDIRHNPIQSKQDAIMGLRECDALTQVFLEGFGEFEDPVDYADDLFAALPNIEEIDEHPNSNSLSADVRDAARFLRAIAGGYGVGANRITEVDLSNRGLTDDVFFLVLAGLSQLPVKTLVMSGNPWDSGVGPQQSSYRNYVVAELQQLSILDGVEIGDDERANSIEFVEKEAKKYGVQVKKENWRKTKDQAWIAANARKIKNKDSGPKIKDFKLKSGQGGEDANGGAKIEFSPDETAAKMSTAIAPVMAATGSMLNKVEILIGFFQVYDMVLRIDIDIPWPQVWVDFSMFFDWMSGIFSLDIDLAFDKLEFEVNQDTLSIIKFGATLAIPGLFIFLYHSASRLNHEKWALRYVDNWATTKCRAIFIWLLLLAVSFFIGVMADQPTSLDNLKEGQAPTGKSNSIIALLWIIISSVFFVWYLIIKIFRSNYITKTGRGGSKFFKFWAKSKRALQRASLFVITILYMPVSREIVNSFAPEYDRENCSHLIDDRKCCVKSWDQPCLHGPTLSFSPVQFAAMFFALAYCIGVPLFFSTLIRTGVKEIDIRGYLQKRDDIKSLIVKEKEATKEAEDKKQRKAHKTRVKELNKTLGNFYASMVKQNPKAQAYLYAAYERKFRYYKIIHMLEKISLIIVAAFVGLDSASLRTAASNVVVGAIALFALIARPFNDGMEDAMDVFSRITNTVNVFLAYALLETKIGIGFSSTILMGLNVMNLGLFGFNMIFSPIRHYMAIKQFRVAERLRISNFQNLANQAGVSQ